MYIFIVQTLGTALEFRRRAIFRVSNRNKSISGKYCSKISRLLCENMKSRDYVFHFFLLIRDSMGRETEMSGGGGGGGRGG